MSDFPTHLYPSVVRSLRSGATEPNVAASQRPAPSQREGRHVAKTGR